MVGDLGLISIGLPVYNGERYLSSAIESLLNQDYENLELVISDNASTDGTEDICRRFVRNDRRVTFHKNSTNLGAAANFNLVFEASRGKYFMWASHDDLWQPTYVRKCAEMLEVHNDVVLCSADINFMDKNGESLKYDTYNRLHTQGMNLRERVRSLTERCGWFALYGVVRPEVLRRTRLYTNAYGGDVILFMELLFQGCTAVVPEKLFSCRQVFKTSARYMEDISGTVHGRLSFKPYTEMAINLIRVIERSAVREYEKAWMREDLLQNVCVENEYWSRMIADEHASVAQVPTYRQSVELRALLMPGMTPTELRLCRLAALRRYVVDRWVSPVAPKPLLKMLVRGMALMRRLSS